MRRLTLPGLICLCLFGLEAFAAPRPAAAAAQNMAATSSKRSTSSVASTQTIYGTLVSSTDKSLVIKTTKGKEMTFLMDEKTAKPKQLKEGERVRVQYVAEKGSDRAVKVIEQSTTAKGGNSSKNHGS